MRDSHIWVFDAGNSFSGNPQWLYRYVNEQRPEITAHWFCLTKQQLNDLKQLGISGHLYSSLEAEHIGMEAGVYVVDDFVDQQPRYQQIPFYLRGAKILNLWHGVGCKNVGRAVQHGDMHEELVSRFLRNRQHYSTYQLFVAPSPLMEQHFMDQLCVREEQILRAGYPRNSHEVQPQTFDHDIKKRRGLGEDTRIVAYVPTYRDDDLTGFFARAMPNIEQLLATLEEQNLLLVLKVHPLLEQDAHYQLLKARFGDEPRLLFWDNRNDFFEVINQVDTAVVDYSALFYDLVAHGVKRYIRYWPDLEEYRECRGFALDIESLTCGAICTTFDELLASLGTCDATPDEELACIRDTFWQHATDHDCKTIVDAALAFKPEEIRPIETLFTYDVLDTLIARRTLQPDGIYCFVKQRMNNSGIDFPTYFVRNYEKIRFSCEENCRESFIRSAQGIEDARREITFDDIFEHMQLTYDLTDEQVKALKDWELECELLASVPIDENVNEVKMLLNAHANVAFIADIYLPRDFMRKLLAQADPELVDVPLYLSSEVGLIKGDKSLYLHIFHDIDFTYDLWVHKGDNGFVDATIPRELGMQAIRYRGGVWPGEHALELIEAVPTYDAYQVNRVISRFENDAVAATEEDLFAYAYASLIFVPYLYWMVTDAAARGIRCLYFTSQDGYHLKRAAEALIEELELPLRACYLDMSRTSICVPSQRDELDDDFFGDRGAFAGVLDYESLLAAGALDEETFLSLFPELSGLANRHAFTIEQNEHIRSILKSSEAYRAHVLEQADARRPAAIAYLAQHVDFSEPYAFVEYLGRGYLQSCLSRLLVEAGASSPETTFYYARCTYLSEGTNRRLSFMTSTEDLLFIQSLLENHPNKNVRDYELDAQGKASPVIDEHVYLEPVFNALEKQLPEFARDFAAIPFYDAHSTMLDLVSFAVHHFAENAAEPIYLNCVAPLKDPVPIDGKTDEFAPEWTMRESYQRLFGTMKLTSNRDMSLARSKPIFKAMFWGFQGLKATSAFFELEKEMTIGARARLAARKAQRRTINPAVERYRFNVAYPNAYRKRAEKLPVNPRKVVFLDVHETEMPDSFTLIWRELERRGGFELSYLTVDDNHVNDLQIHQNMLSIAKELADAAYIFVADANDLVSCLPIREETFVTQTWHACGAFKKWGMSTANLGFGRSRQGLLEHPYYKNLDLVTVSSPEVEWAYREAMVLEDTPEVVQPTGVSRTDVFFDPEFLAAARRRIEDAVPAARGKKILLYAPTYRGTIKNAQGPNMFDLPMMKAALGDEWVLITKHHPFVHEREPIPTEVADFAFDVSEQCAIDDLLASADACITDYSSIVFEYSLFERPMIFYPYDLGNYLNQRGFYYDYSQMTPGPIFFRTEGVIDYLTHLDERFDPQVLRDFKNRFMQSCDGHATERILETVFGSELERHRNA